MFQTLLASTPQAPPGLSRFLASISLHALVLVLAVGLTSMHPAVVLPAREARMPILLPTPHPGRPEQVGPSAPRSPFRAPIPSSPPVIEPPAVPLPDLGFSVPTMADVLSSASRFGGVDATPPTDVTPGSSPALRNALEVDDPVQLLEQPPVGYPAALAQASVEGHAELEFVVDTL